MWTRDAWRLSLRLLSMIIGLFLVFGQGSCEGCPAIQEGSAEHYEVLGKRLAEAGHVDEAIQAYEESIRLDSCRVGPYEACARLHLREGKQQLAIDDLSKFIDRCPGSAWPYIARGKLFNKLGMEQRALEDFNAAVRLDAANIPALENRASILARLGKSSEARKDQLTMFRIQDEKQLPVIPSVASNKPVEGNPEAVLNVIRELALAADPFNRDFVSKVTKHPIEGAEKGPVPVMEQIIGIGNVSCEQDLKAYQEVFLLLDLNACCVRIRDVVRALRLGRPFNIDPLLSSDKDSERIYALSTGNKLMLTLETMDSKMCVCQVSILSSENCRRKAADDLVQRADVCCKMKKFDQALRALKRAEALDSSNDWVLRMRANVYRDQKRYADALACYTVLIERNPRGIEGYNNRAVTFMLMKDYSSAIAEYNRCISVADSDERFHVFASRASAYLASGDFRKAISDLNVAVSANYRRAEWFERRAEAKEKLGDRAGAIADLKEAAKAYLWEINIQARDSCLAKIGALEVELH